MTRDEVLERLEEKIQSAKFFQIEVVDIQFLRAAAELIRAGGWRPIAEFTDGSEYLTCGAWVNGQWNVARVMLSKPRAIALGYTHYLPEPEPPAREVENG